MSEKKSQVGHPGPARRDIVGVVLAGGMGARMGGADKGWVAWEGRPLVERVLERLRPQVAEVMISANRSLARYRALGCTVVQDDTERLGAFQGPLAGILAALEALPGGWAVFVPCDAPNLPGDLVQRLAEAGGGRRPAVARCGGHVQPVFCLLPASLAPQLRAALQGGERRPDRFLARCGAIEVEFRQAEQFVNVNTPPAGAGMMQEAELELDQAFKILARARPPVDEVERVALPLSRGRVLARPLVAPMDLPGLDLAAMDGYALRSRDALQERNVLKVVGSLQAGQPPSGPVGAGACLRIMTGAPLPEDCDAVVMQEVASSAGDGEIVIPGPVASGLNRRRRGEHVRAGNIVLPAGRWLRPADLALAAALGAESLEVFRRLKVGVLSTGDELRDAPGALASGNSYDSNRPMILASLGQTALEGVDLGICPDDSARLLRVLEHAAAAGLDAVLISGGASVGEADIVRALPEVSFLRLRMRPGRGLAWTRFVPAGAAGQEAAPARSPLVLGLPGNPVAAYVQLHLLVRPVLARLAGADAGPPAPIALPLACEVQNRAGRVQLRTARLLRDATGTTLVEPLEGQGSAMIRSVCEAQALVTIGPQATYRAGERVPSYLLDALAYS